ncbi:hypothetical protein Nepgr_033750 [Nepenthes gracilis]|uniref:Uncharacterized protein n=1 Tax=Nepenthes gracilis TaxID=150966 RepID=A0AAD3Y946_NEPGR|nr:hypothetical protein Nepgr_033750 [Nepenthes gracilis]
MVVDSILRGPGVSLGSWLPGLSNVAHCCSLCRFGSPPMLPLTWCDDVDDFVPIGFPLLSWSGRLATFCGECVDGGFDGVIFPDAEGGGCWIRMTLSDAEMRSYRRPGGATSYIFCSALDRCFFS